MNTPQQLNFNRALLRLQDMLIDAKERVRAEMTNEYGTSTVTVTDVDAADNRVYAENAIGLTLCLQPEQLTEIRFEPMKRVAKFMDAA